MSVRFPPLDEAKLRAVVDEFATEVEAATKDGRAALKFHEVPRLMLAKGQAWSEPHQAHYIQRTQLEQLESAQRFTSHVSQLIGAEPDFFFGSSDESPDRLPLYAVSRFSEAVGTWVRVDTESLFSYVKKLVRAIRAEKIEYTHRQILLGVTLELEQVELSPTVRLVRLSDPELTHWIDIDPKSTDTLKAPEGGWHRVELRIQQTCAHEPGSSVYFKSQRQDDRCVQLQAEAVKAAVLMHSPAARVDLGDSFEAPIRLLEFLSPRLTKAAAPIIQADATVISEKSICALKRAYEAATFQPKNIKEKSSFGTALRRFCLGCDRLSHEDAVVDFVIGLETLLLQREVGELSYRIKLHGSSFAHWALGTSRQVGADILADAYAARSSAVHGSDRIVVTWTTVSLLRVVLANLLAWTAEGGLDAAIQALEALSGEDSTLEFKDRPKELFQKWELLLFNRRPQGFSWLPLSPLTKAQRSYVRSSKDK